MFKTFVHVSIEILFLDLLPIGIHFNHYF